MSDSMDAFSRFIKISVDGEKLARAVLEQALGAFRLREEPEETPEPLHKTYLREDMMHLTLGDDPEPWTSAYGGEITTGPSGTKYEPLELERIRADSASTTRHLYIHSSAVGHYVNVRCEHLDRRGEKTGRGFVYRGILGSVGLAPYDANSDRVATDKATVFPSSVKPL